jgi:hypothetical protein
MFALNPAMGIVITTNATVLGPRAKSIIEQGHCSFNVSIDSLDPLVYERIRKPAHFDVTYKHLKYLIDYTRRKGTHLTLAVCPMNMNWSTLGALAEFCINEKIQLYLNLVTKPYSVALWPLSQGELMRISDHLQMACVSLTAHDNSGVAAQMQILIHQIETWARQSGFFQKHLSSYLMKKEEFEDRIKAVVMQDSLYREGSSQEQGLFERKLGEVLRSLPHEFFTDFFLERICKIPASKIYNEISDEQCETTAGNLCSIYYYARGEVYSKHMSSES